MKRPSFQFYPADWRNNANLGRCSEAARGAWVDILCVLHDSDEYGIVRWPLSDLVRASRVSTQSAAELVEKAVLKGSDSGMEAFTHTTRHAGMETGTHILIPATQSPCWFSSRMVIDEWVRKRRGGETRFGSPPKSPPNRAVGGGSGDGPTSSSTSTSSLGTRTQRATAEDHVAQNCPEVPSEDEAVTMMMTAGIPDDFIRYIYRAWSSRSGKDGAGVLVSLTHYITNRWKNEQNEWRAGTHKGKKQTRQVAQKAKTWQA